MHCAMTIQRTTVLFMYEIMYSQFRRFLSRNETHRFYWSSGDITGPKFPSTNVHYCIAALLHTSQRQYASDKPWKRQ
jgi:hypothetical protein